MWNICPVKNIGIASMKLQSRNEMTFIRVIYRILFPKKILNLSDINGPRRVLEMWINILIDFYVDIIEFYVNNHHSIFLSPRHISRIDAKITTFSGN